MDSVGQRQHKTETGSRLRKASAAHTRHFFWTRKGDFQGSATNPEGKAKSNGKIVLRNSNRALSRNCQLGPDCSAGRTGQALGASHIRSGTGGCDGDVHVSAWLGPGTQTLPQAPVCVAGQAPFRGNDRLSWWTWLRQNPLPDAGRGGAHPVCMGQSWHRDPATDPSFCRDPPHQSHLQLLGLLGLPLNKTTAEQRAVKPGRLPGKLAAGTDRPQGARPAHSPCRDPKHHICQTGTGCVRPRREENAWAPCGKIAGTCDSRAPSQAQVASEAGSAPQDRCPQAEGAPPRGSCDEAGHTCL